MILGALPRKKDRRDIKLEKVHSALGQASTYPDVYLTDLSYMVQNWQDKFPACGSHSGAHFIQAFNFFEKGTRERFSPAFLWKKIKQIDGYAPEVGTDMRSIFKALQKNGICLYDMLPNDYKQNLAQYTDASVITKAMEDDAQPRIIGNYAFGTDLSFEGIKKAIYLNKVVLLLIHCDNGFFGRIKGIFTKRSYGHFVIGLNYDKDDIIIFDSTETAYPIKKINKKYVGFVRELGTAVDLSDQEIKNKVTQISLLTKIIELTKRLNMFKK